LHLLLGFLTARGRGHNSSPRRPLPDALPSCAAVGGRLASFSALRSCTSDASVAIAEADKAAKPPRTTLISQVVSRGPRPRLDVPQYLPLPQRMSWCPTDERVAAFQLRPVPAPQHFQLSAYAKMMEVIQPCSPKPPWLLHCRGQIGRPETNCRPTCAC